MDSTRTASTTSGKHSDRGRSEDFNTTAKAKFAEFPRGSPQSMLAHLVQSLSRLTFWRYEIERPCRRSSGSGYRDRKAQLDEPRSVVVHAVDLGYVRPYRWVSSLCGVHNLAKSRPRRSGHRPESDRTTCGVPSPAREVFAEHFCPVLYRRKTQGPPTATLQMA